MKRIKLLFIFLLIFSFVMPVYAASNNNDLKVLEVENHKIYYNKERTKYKVVLEEGENSLNISAIADDSKSKVKIVGADDLKANYYKVTVTVTAENGSKKEYEITAQEKNKIIEEEEVGFFDELLNKISEMNIKMEYIYIGIGSLVGLILIIVGVRIYKDKKMEKTMDKF